MSAKQKYFLCYLRTGGGHLAPARSIAQYLSSVRGNDIEPVLVDGLARAHRIARFVIEDGYRILQAKAKWYYELIYFANKAAFIGQGNVLLAKAFIKKDLKRRIAEERPAKIVIFHFLMVQPVYEILAELGLAIPVVTVVTDPFTAHPMWFKYPQQRFIVFSERLRQYCIVQKKIPETTVHLFPFIVDQKFTAALSPEQVQAVKAVHGLSSGRPAILIIGGGDGIPHGRLILQHLLSADLNADIAIVCGRNEELHADALALQRSHPSLIVFGFVDFVYDLINAADVVITKCGASTIMEILLLKKIPVITDFLWEQELGNMEFVRDNHLGIFERNIARLPAIIRELTTEPEAADRFIRTIEAMHLRSGTKEVAEFIAALPAVPASHTRQ